MVWRDERQGNSLDNAGGLKFFAVCLCVGIGLLLQSCAFLPFQAPMDDHMQQWSAEGRLAVRQNKDSRTANFKWDYRSQNDYSVRLFGPLGTYANQLIKTPTTARLITDKGSEVRADSVESLSEQALGLRLPVQSMTWWARGKPDPSRRLTQTVQTEKVLQFEQRGWNVRVTYPDSRPNGAWPRKVVLTQHQTRAVLVFHKWTTFDGDVH